MKLHTGLVLLGLCVVGCQRAGQPLAPSPVVALSASADKKAPAPTSGVTLSLNARGWTEGLTPTYVSFRNDAAGALYFDVPSQVVGYAFTASPARSLAGTLRIAMRVDAISGVPSIVPVEPCAASGATARPFIFSHRNDWSGEFSRWWSNPDRVVLAPGVFSLTVPLTPDRWSSVFGKRGTAAPADFASALADVSSLGVTFGSDCAFGHGVAASGGSARWVLSSFAIN